VAGGGATIKAAGGDIKLIGRSLLQSQTFDDIVLTEGGGPYTASLQIAMLKPGVSGYSVEVLTAGGTGVSLAVTLVGKKLTIQLATGGSTDADIATEINKNGGVCDGLMRANTPSLGPITTARDVPLTGGVGDWDNNIVMVGGLEALPSNQPGTITTAKWTNTEIDVTTLAVGAATDVVTTTIRSNAVLSQSLSAVLA
jgi:hypothetical protein